MKTILKTQLFFLLILFATDAFPQAGEWIWISGSNVTGSMGVYGVQGVPSVNNYPPGLYEYSEWKDLQGNLWLFGGWDPPYSDLWKFNPSTLEWTWVKGNGLTFQNPVFGTKGVSNPANSPGQRPDCSASWVDLNGNLWLFGGDITRNDLWKYDISTNEWTWMSGSNMMNSLGTYGTLGVPSPLNEPPARNETCTAWSDSLNNLWLFGGSGSIGFLNDLWMYSITNNEWTWMSGSNSAGALSVYGTLGVSSPTNSPGARITYTKWKDYAGNFWFMGGGEWPDWKDDVWKFDPDINQWTWMAGTTVANDFGVYQNTCVAGLTNRPSARVEQRSTVTDNCGRFWLFGGMDPFSGFLNDLWVFDPIGVTWMWVSGTNAANQPNIYGTLGVSSPTNQPASRWGSISWWGDDERFYLLGGNNNNVGPSFADLWVFTPDPTCTPPCSALPVAAIAAPNEICPGSCINFTSLSINATSYLWTFNGASVANSTDQNPQSICYNTPGVYDVTLIAYNSYGTDTMTLNSYITVYPFPPAQGILQGGDTLYANPGSVSYQWYIDNTIINGATNYFYVASQSGNYNVVCTDTNNCEVEAVIYDVLAGTSTSLYENEGVSVSPNPAKETLVVKRHSLNGTATDISIFNMLAEKMMSYPLQNGDQKTEYMLDIHSLPAGK